MGWLGIVAVLSNVLAATLCYAPGRTAGLVDGAAHLLCTSEGLQTAPPPGGNPEQPTNDRSHCTACTLLAGLAVAVAFAFVAIAFPTGVFRRLRSKARTLADHLSLGGIRSRAPPVPA